MRWWLVLTSGCASEGVDVERARPLDGARVAVRNVTVDPPVARVGETLTCSWEFVGDPGRTDRSTVRWYVGETEVGQGPTFDTTSTPAGSDVWCRVEPQDGVEVGAPVFGSARIPGNVVVFLLDDVGTDRLASYGFGLFLPETPTIDGLGANGLVFDHAWAQPTCSPGRASILTGRLPAQHGIGYALPPTNPRPLGDEELTLPELLREGSGGRFASAWVGKWHLSSLNLGLQGALEHPNVEGGFDFFSGVILGLSRDASTDQLAQTYWDWEEVTQGVPVRRTEYLTTRLTDVAIDQFDTMQEPFLLVVAHHAAHAPYHLAPEDLRVSASPTGVNPRQAKEQTMIEAVDTEMGRFLSTVSPDRLDRTTVFVTSDNGTPGGVASEPYLVGRAKGTAYEGGIRVPLLAWGLGVDRPGDRSSDLVSGADLYATIADLGGVAIPDDGIERDTVSFRESLGDPSAAPARTHVVAQGFHGSASQPLQVVAAVRDARFKLLNDGSVEHLFDLGNADSEGDDLLVSGPLSPEAQSAYEELRLLLDDSLL